MAEFVVKYRAIVYRPFKDETVDGIVSIVNKVGAHVPGDSSAFAVASGVGHSLTTRVPLFFCVRWASMSTWGH